MGIKESWKKILLQKAYGKEILEYHTDDRGIYDKSSVYTNWKEIKRYNMVEEKNDQKFVRKISFF